MTNAILEGAIADGHIIPVSANGTNIITKGDWVAFSGRVAVPVTDATPVAGIYRPSAAGLALMHNPIYDDQGVAKNNSGLLVMRQGLMRQSAAHSATAGTIPLGSPAYPDVSASGVVGQTGATGHGPVWATAAAMIITTAAGGTASVTLAPVGVAQVVNVIGAGDATAIQFDLAFNLATNAF